MNRRQFLKRIPLIGAAIVAAPAVALAIEPQLAMGGTIESGTPYLIGESGREHIVSTEQISRIFGVPPHMVQTITRYPGYTNYDYRDANGESRTLRHRDMKGWALVTKAYAQSHTS